MYYLHVIIVDVFRSLWMLCIIEIPQLDTAYQRFATGRSGRRNTGRIDTWFNLCLYHDVTKL